jgi:hypothetical protein
VSARRDDLNALLAKVEAGDIPDTGVGRFRAIPRRGGGVYADPNWYDANNAYWRADLNAAKALHEAIPTNAIMDDETAKLILFGKNGARIWLAWKLRALISQDTTQDGKP